MSFEDIALKALQQTFIDEYVILHPRIGNCVPDAVSLKIGGSLRISGFEVKGSRSDWLYELKTKKNAASRATCDYWSIIAKKGIAKLSDIPHDSGWGLYEVESDRLSCIVAPSQLRPLGPVSRDLASYLVHAALNRTPRTEQIEKLRDEVCKEVCEFVFGQSLFVKTKFSTLKAFAELFERRVEIKAIRQLMEISTTALQLSKDIDEHLSRIKNTKDWESNKTFPPEAEKMSEIFKTQLLEHRSYGDYYKKNPALLKASIHQKLMEYFGYKQP